MARNETAFTDYDSKVESDAESFVEQEWDDVRQQAKDGEYGSRNDIMSDLYDSLHEFLDQEIDLYEAADILGQCRNEESDWGLWEGLKDPEKAIGVKAFYSFKNDVYDSVKDEFRRKLEELKIEEETVFEEFENNLYKINKHISDFEEKIDELNDDNEDGQHDDIIDEYSERLQKASSEVERLEEKVSDQETVISNIQDAIDTL